MSDTAQVELKNVDECKPLPTWLPNWDTKDSPVASSAPRPATKAICSRRGMGGGGRDKGST